MTWIDGEVNIEHVSVDGVKALNNVSFHQLARYVFAAVTWFNDNYHGRTGIAVVVFYAEATDKRPNSAFKGVSEGQICGCKTTTDNGNRYHGSDPGAGTLWLYLRGLEFIKHQDLQS